MIRIERLSKTYPHRRALTDVNLDVPRGQRLGLVGEPGSGRTTLLRAIAAVIPLSDGRVVVDGVDARRDPFAVRRTVFLAGHYPTGGDMATGEYLHLVSASRPGRPDRALISDVASAAGLPLSVRIRDLAKPERRVLAAAAAVVSGAAVLLLDDLFDACGEAERQAIGRVFNGVSAATVVAVAGAPADLAGVCDRIVHLADGRVWQ